MDFKNIDSIDDLIDTLVNRASKEVLNDACHDALLILNFFPQLGPNFRMNPDLYEDDVEEFKHSFDYEQLGLDRETALKKIAKYRSIDRTLDALTEMLSEDTKQKLVKRYLLEFWFKQNSNGDLEHFKNSLREDYWFKV